MRRNLPLRRGLAATLAACLPLASACASSVARSPQLVPAVALESIDESEYEILGNVRGTGRVGAAFCFTTGDREFAFPKVVGDEWGQVRKYEPNLATAFWVVLFGASGLSIDHSIKTRPLPPPRDAVAAATFDAWKKAPPDADLLIPSGQLVSGGTPDCFYTSHAEVWAKAVRIKNQR